MRRVAWRRSLAVLLLVGSLSAVNGCAFGVMYVRIPPPPRRAEVRGRPPGPAYVWVPGYYRWNGAYIWVAGLWVRPPYRGAVWVPGRWIHSRRGWHYAKGHWRRR